MNVQTVLRKNLSITPIILFFRFWNIHISSQNLCMQMQN